MPLFVVDAVDLGKDQKAHARYRQQKAVHEFKDVYGTPAVVVDHQDAIQQQDERHGEEDLEDHRLKDSAGVGNVLPYLAGLVGHPDGNALAQEPHGRSGGVESHVGGVAELVLVALFDGVRFFRIARIQRDFPRPMGRGHNGTGKTQSWTWKAVAEARSLPLLLRRKLHGEARGRAWQPGLGERARSCP